MNIFRLKKILSSIIIIILISNSFSVSFAGDSFIAVPGASECAESLVMMSDQLSRAVNKTGAGKPGIGIGTGVFVLLSLFAAVAHAAPAAHQKNISLTVPLLGISFINLGVGVLIVLVFVAVLYGKRILDGIIEVIEQCRMNLGKKAGEETDFSAERLHEEGIKKIKKGITGLSHQIRKDIFEALEKQRKIQIRTAFTENVPSALSSYKYIREVSEQKFNNLLQEIQDELAKIPKGDVEYHDKVKKWILKVKNIFKNYNVESFLKKVDDELQARKKTAHSLKVPPENKAAQRAL